jgi:hypothetical protein
MFSISTFEKKVKTVMVNNSIIINKTNNHLLVHTNVHNIKPTTYGVVNPGSVLGHATKVCKLFKFCAHDVFLK